MRIKQIELNGFKSFMERTVLELPAGVTAIVGPNGCGKSNIVDAIRWLLGEQSPRHLRGAAMEDVIFSGNGECGPLGMAEVSLLLERDEEDLVRARESVDDELPGDGLPAELANLSEILVTRRYFRSGESEYFINRAPCRLRDITELFLGTGVGTRAYAIIEQGRVDQLISAKPEDLRLFLEEAAGTTRFRSRRVAAERKMERTRENLLRVQDIVRELERQMASLERQARRAEEYHRIKGELRALDLQVMAARHRAWTADLEELQVRRAALHATEASLQEEIRRTRGATDAARASRVSNEEQLRAVDERLTAAKLTAAESQTRADSQQGRVEELDARAIEARREGDRLAVRLAELEAEGARLDAELAMLAADEPGATAALTEAAARLEELVAAGQPLEHEVEHAKDVLLDALAEEARARTFADVLRQRRQDLEGRRRKLEEVQQRLGERLHDNARATDEARGAIARLEGERDRLREQRVALLAEQARQRAVEAEQVATAERARAELTRLRSHQASLHELQARYEGCARGVANLVERDPRQAALVASVLRVPQGLERAVAAALGPRLGQVVVGDTNAAVQAVGWLRQSAAGSATVVPRDPERRAPVIVPAGLRLLDQIEVDPQHWALAEALLGEVLLADDLEAALRVWRGATHAVTVVTRTGEAIDALGAVTGGSEPPLEETLLARERELRQLEESLAAAQKDALREDDALLAARARLDESRHAIEGLEEQLSTLGLDRVAAEKDRERLEAERERIAAELEVGALEAGGLAGEDGEVADEMAALEERVASASRGVTERRARLAERQDAQARWRDGHAAAERAHTEAAVRLAALGERLRAARTESTRLGAAAVEAKERLLAVQRQADEAVAGAQAARAAIAAATAAHAEAGAQASALASERERLLAAIAESQSSQSADDLAERAAQEGLEAARQEAGRLEVALTERRLALEHLVAQLAERYALQVEVLAEVTIASDEPDGERAERVEALRARLVRLGDVNPGAMAELREFRERHGFLLAQRADLERSLEDLRRTISKLARTSRQRFEETFTAANEKLADVFPKLFPGGQARLELTELEDTNEPGVEIVVQPAGKKLQSLSLLSGGEKALTAVSLILSLFLIRPTPFCLLDEVDAPLDEANLGRFNQLVREMAVGSQFVLITHNRRTMEAADTLYGITMEKAGVSKVVSVRLREAA